MKIVNKIKAGHKFIGQGEPCFIVAEAGINHNGDVILAKKMIDLAVEAGADAVKFQAFRAGQLLADKELLYTHTSQGKEVTESQYDMFERCEFSEDQFRQLFDYAREKGIICFATPQNVSDLEILLRIKVPMIKVGSDDLTNLPLLKNYASRGLPMIISTGMANLGEVEEAVGVIKSTGNNELVVLKCISSYPTSMKEVNLRSMQTLKQAFGVIVGFSDHTQGITAAIGAVALGAKVIEKHFTLDKNLPGPDHWFSADPKELKELVKGIRDIEEALGSSIVKPTKEEKEEMITTARRSIVADRNISAGERIIPEMITYRRPGNGLLPKFTDFLVGRTAKQDIKKGEQITFEKLE